MELADRRVGAEPRRRDCVRIHHTGPCASDKQQHSSVEYSAARDPACWKHVHRVRHPGSAGYAVAIWKPQRPTCNDAAHRRCEQSGNGCVQCHTPCTFCSHAGIAVPLKVALANAANANTTVIALGFGQVDPYGIKQLGTVRSGTTKASNITPAPASDLHPFRKGVQTVYIPQPGESLVVPAFSLSCRGMLSLLLQ